MATSAKRRAQYQAAGLLPMAGAVAVATPGVAPDGGTVTFAGGRTHAVSGKTAGLEASAAQNQQYLVYAVAFVGLVAAGYFLIRAYKG